MKKKQETVSLWFDEITTFEYYLNALTEIATSIFRWEGLPETVDVRFLERCLFYQGQVLYFNDDIIGDLCLPFASSGGFDVYQNPVVRRAYASNGYSAYRNESDSVIIYNNYSRTNTYYAIRNFAKTLTDIDRSIWVNAKAQKTPMLLRCKETQRLTLENAYAQYDGNKPVIYGEKDFDANSISAINTGAPFVADRLYQLKTQLWNEALTYLGVSNVNFVKKERLISDEVIRSQGGTIASRYGRLEARKQAANKITVMFGNAVTVDYRDDYSELAQVTTDNSKFNLVKGVL